MRSNWENEKFQKVQKFHNFQKVQKFHKFQKVQKFHKFHKNQKISNKIKVSNVRKSQKMKKTLFRLFYTFCYLINLFRHLIGESEGKSLISYQMAKVAYFDLF